MKSLLIDRAVLTDIFVKLSMGRVVELEEQLRFFKHFDIVYFDPENVSAFIHVLQHSRQQNNLTGFTAIDRETSRRHAELARTLLYGVHQGIERQPLIVNAMDQYGAESGKGRPDIPSALEYIFYLVSLCQFTGSSLLVWRARAHALCALAKVFELNLETADEGSSLISMMLKAFPWINEDGAVSAFDLTIYLIDDRRGILAKRQDRGAEGLTQTDVFVSYARPDGDFVANLVNALEERGFRVWWDNEIRLGHRFPLSIERALNDAKAVLVIWSESSIRSSWVIEEALEGKDRDKLLAIALDEVRPPLGFRQFQTLDMQRAGDWRDSDAFATLTVELKRRCQRD